MIKKSWWTKCILVHTLILCSITSVQAVSFDRIKSLFAQKPLDVPDEAQKKWYELFDRFDFKVAPKSAAVQNYINLYKNDSYHLKKSLENMAPYVPWLVEQLERHNLPGEIALIPLVESCYQPQALVKSSKALGLWQLVPITAEHYKMKNSWAYESRMDVVASTSVALKHLCYLYNEFKSWPLVLAAYNAGPSRVKEAMRKANYKSEKDFAKLALPEQTQQYLPKIYALTYLLKNHKKYGITLPDLTEHLQPIALDYHWDFTHLSLALNLPVPILKKYNPAYGSFMLPKEGTYHLMVPKSSIDHLEKPISEILHYVEKNPYYTIAEGDSLLKVSLYFGQPVNVLMKHNKFSTSSLPIGTRVEIPLLSDSHHHVIKHKVQSGDSLYQLAQEYGTTVTAIMQLNELQSSKIRENQVLTIRMSPRI